MSGLSILNTWLNKNDPVKYINKTFDIYVDFNAHISGGFINKIKRWWIEKVTYPIMRHKVKKIQIDTANLLYDHPDLLVFVLTRFLLSLQMYIDIYKDITIEQLLDALFTPNTISINIDKDIVDSNKYLILGYNITIRSYIVSNLLNRAEDKFAITSISTNIEKSNYTISQIVYDTNDKNNFSMANVLYSKEFRLTPDGKLSNPNYILDNSILEEDLMYYRLMVSQFMAFIGGFFDELTKIYFIDIRAK